MFRSKVRRTEVEGGGELCPTQNGQKVSTLCRLKQDRGHTDCARKDFKCNDRSNEQKATFKECCSLFETGKSEDLYLKIWIIFHSDLLTLIINAIRWPLKSSRYDFNSPWVRPASLIRRLLKQSCSPLRRKSLKTVSFPLCLSSQEQIELQNSKIRERKKRFQMKEMNGEKKKNMSD